MNDETAFCVGGHFVSKKVMAKDFQYLPERFFGQVKIPIARIVNAQGRIVPHTKKLMHNMLNRDVWEVEGGSVDTDSPRECDAWLASLAVDFRRPYGKSMFLGVDRSIAASGNGKWLEEFYINEVLSVSEHIRYAYCFEREKSRGPQQYVSGVRVTGSWKNYAIEADPLLSLWRGRVTSDTTADALRDVFSTNFFLMCEENTFIPTIVETAKTIGELEQLGNYLIWRLKSEEIAVARQMLIFTGCIS